MSVLRKYKILAFGEVLWDMFPSGKVLGGAPANFAYHSAMLGAETRIVTSVGNDPLGKEALEKCRELGMNTDFISIHESACTGSVDVLFSSGEPQYRINDGVAWNEIVADEAVLKFAADCDAIYFGTLAMRSVVSRSTLKSLIERTPKTTLRICDINLRPPHYTEAIIQEALNYADVLKLNDDEFKILSELFGFKDIVSLIGQFDLKNVIYTCGSQGSFLFSKTESVFVKAETISLADTVGAGDAFTAVSVNGLLRNLPIEEINKKAAIYAAFVCSQFGATPKIPDELRFQ